MRHFRMAVAAACVMALSAFSAASASAAGPVGIPQFPSLRPAGDFDGDGLPDVIAREIVGTQAVIGGDAQLVVRAVGGTTGATLWSVTVPALDALTVPLSLGPEGGLLVSRRSAGTTLPQSSPCGVATGTACIGAGLNGRAGVTMLTVHGGDGTVRWERELQPGAALATMAPTDALRVGSAASDERDAALVTGPPGAADRIAVTSVTAAGTRDAGAGEVTVRLYDAATGAVAAERAVATSGSAVHALGAPDLDGDGWSELVLLDTTRPGRLTMLSGADLAVRWETELPGVRDEPLLVDLGDLDGDGVRDLAVSSRAYTGPDWVTTVVSGRAGTVLLHDAAFSVLAAGGEPDVVLARYVTVANERQLRFVGARLDGTTLYDVAYPLPSNSSAGITVKTDVGDLDGDGVRDLLVRVHAGGALHSGAVLSGRDGSVAAVHEGGAGWMGAGSIVGVSVGGASGFVEVFRTPDDVWMSLVVGVEETPRWTRRYTGPATSGAARLVPVDLDRDGVDELLVNIEYHHQESSGGPITITSTVASVRVGEALDVAAGSRRWGW